MITFASFDDPPALPPPTSLVGTPSQAWLAVLVHTTRHRGSCSRVRDQVARIRIQNVRA